jgi:hypothetical protein
MKANWIDNSNTMTWSSSWPTKEQEEKEKQHSKISLGYCQNRNRKLGRVLSTIDLEWIVQDSNSGRNLSKHPKNEWWHTPNKRTTCSFRKYFHRFRRSKATWTSYWLRIQPNLRWFTKYMYAYNVFPILRPTEPTAWQYWMTLANTGTHGVRLQETSRFSMQWYERDSNKTTTNSR